MGNQVASTPCLVSIIAEVDIYKFHPWELPAKAVFGDQEWYFFSPRDRKYPNGVRPNRSAASGYWKATGTDKPIHTGKEKELIGVKKTLVFYKGRPPKGLKTNWIMHEYRLADAQSSSTSYKSMKPIDSTSMTLDDWVLCRIYKKCSHSWSQSVIDGEQEEWCSDDCEVPSPQKRQQESTTEMPRSSSLLDFLEDYSRLSQLYDDLPEMPGLDDGSPMGNSSARQPLISDRSNSSSGINYLVQKLLKAGSPALIARSCMKRQWTAEGESTELLTPSKNLHDSHDFTGPDKELGNRHCSMMSQSMFNQQLLLNSNLELQ